MHTDQRPSAPQDSSSTTVGSSAVSIQILSASTASELASILIQATSSKHHPLPRLSQTEGDFQISRWLKLQDEDGSQLHYAVIKENRVIGHIGFLSFFPEPDSIKDGVSGGVRPGANSTFHGQVGDVICHLDHERANLRDAVETFLTFLSSTLADPSSELSRLTFVSHREDLLPQQVLEAAEIKFERKEPGNDSVASVLTVILADCDAEVLNRRLQCIENIPQLPLFLEQREEPANASHGTANPIMSSAEPARSNRSAPTTQSDLSLTLINFDSTMEFDILLEQRKIAGWYNTPAALKTWATTCNHLSKSKLSYWIHSASKNKDSTNGTRSGEGTTNSTRFDPIGHISYETTSPTTTKISQLYISPAHRGAGTAGMVLTILEDRARADPAIEYVLIDTLTRDYWYENTIEMSGSWLRMGSGSPRLGRAACGEDWYTRRGYVLTKKEGRYRNWCVNGEHVELIAVDLQLDVRGAI